ncbi:MAG: hydrogenase-4 component [Actinomycetota bacterium]|nr:hydrogenase-4 component [Actinomycetota bacterium]
MTGPAWVLLGLGLLVVVVQRRTLALGAVSAQVLVLVGLAFADAGDLHEFAATGALAVRGTVLAVVFGLLISRTRDSRPVAHPLKPLLRGALAVGLGLALTWLVPPIGLADRTAEPVVLCLVAFGLLVAATSRATIVQVLGVLLVENGMSLAALQLPGSSWMIELGVAVDVILIALVAGIFHERIFVEFGAGDSAALRSLRD